MQFLKTKTYSFYIILNKIQLLYRYTLLIELKILFVWSDTHKKMYIPTLIFFFSILKQYSIVLKFQVFEILLNYLDSSRVYIWNDRPYTRIGRTRTVDLWLSSQTLYHLSYFKFVISV